MAVDFKADKIELVETDSADMVLLAVFINAVTVEFCVSFTVDIVEKTDVTKVWMFAVEILRAAIVLFADVKNFESVTAVEFKAVKIEDVETEIAVIVEFAEFIKAVMLEFWVSLTADMVEKTPSVKVLNAEVETLKAVIVEFAEFMNAVADEF